MTITGVDALVVGPGYHDFLALTERMRHWGFRCHFAATVRTAQELVYKSPVNLILSNTRLPDGTGFALVAGLSGFPVTAFLCLPVGNSCVWLPAIDDGRNCLGSPALFPLEFATTLEEMARRVSSLLPVN